MSGKLKFLISVILVFPLFATANDSEEKWNLVYGLWSHAPLYGHDFKVTEEYVYIYERSADTFPKGEIICTLPYTKTMTYLAYTTSSTDGSQLHDVFVLALDGSCEWNGQGNILIMAIPENHKRHARVSSFLKLEDLPRERPHIVAESRYIPNNVTWSSGYGLRCSLDECKKYEQ